MNAQLNYIDGPTPQRRATTRLRTSATRNRGASEAPQIARPEHDHSSERPSPGEDATALEVERAIGGAR